MAEHTLEQPVHRRTLVFLAKAGVTAVVIWWLLQMVDISQTLSLLRSVEAGPLIIAVLVLLVQAGGRRPALAIHRSDPRRPYRCRPCHAPLLPGYVLQPDAFDDRRWRCRARLAPEGHRCVTWTGHRRRRAGAAGRFGDTGHSGRCGAAVGSRAGTGCPVASGRRKRGVGHARGSGVTAGVSRIAVAPDLGRRACGSAVAARSGRSLLVRPDSPRGALALWSVSWGLGLDVPLLPCLVLVPPAMLVATLPISLGGWGVREGVLVAAFGLIGVPADAALAVSVAFGILVMVSGVVGLSVWFASRQRD